MAARSASDSTAIARSRSILIVVPAAWSASHEWGESAASASLSTTESSRSPSSSSCRLRACASQQLVAIRYSHVENRASCRNDFRLRQASTNVSVSYTHLRALETPEHLVCRLLL